LSKRIHEEGYTVIPLSQLIESPDNPRKTYDDASLAELADSIRELGVLQPLLVRPLNTYKGKTRYEVVCGHRRARAARRAELDEVPCIVKCLDDRAATWSALVENAQREDVPPLEESDAIQRVVEAGVTPEDIAARIGRPPRWVRDRLRLQHLQPPLAAMLTAGRLPLGGAVLLSALSVDQQTEVAVRVQGDSALPVAEVRRMISAVSRALCNAPWGLHDASLSERGACSVCPMRTGAQGELFGADTKDDRCLDTACYDTKKVAWLEHQAEAGHTVIKGWSPHDAFTVNREVVIDGKPVELDKAAIKKIVYAHEYGGITVAYDRESLADAVEAAGHPQFAANLRPYVEDKAARKAQAKADQERRQAEEDAYHGDLDAVVQHIEDSGFGPVSEPLTRLTIAICYERTALLDVYGFDKTASPLEVLPRLVKTLPESRRLGMLARLLIIQGKYLGTDAWNDLRRMAGVLPPEPVNEDGEIVEAAESEP